MKVSTDTGTILEGMKRLIIEEESPFSFEFDQAILIHLLKQVDETGVARTKVLKVAFDHGCISVTTP